MDLLGPLIKAIATKLTTAPIPAAFPNGVFQDVAPDGTSASAPFLTFNVVSSQRTSKYGGILNSDGRITFTAYGPYDATLAAMVVFNGVFEDATLTLATGHNTNTTQLTEIVPRRDGSDPNDSDVWQFSVDYSFIISP